MSSKIYSIFEALLKEPSSQDCFLDEKPFSIEQAFNPQNDRIWVTEAPAIEDRIVERTQKPKSVMVWDAMTHSGKSPLVFIEEGVKINQDVYRNMLQTHIILWASDHFGNEYCLKNFFVENGFPEPSRGQKK